VERRARRGSRPCAFLHRDRPADAEREGADALRWRAGVVLRASCAGHRGDPDAGASAAAGAAGTGGDRPWRGGCGPWRRRARARPEPRRRPDRLADRARQSRGDRAGDRGGQPADRAALPVHLGGQPAGAFHRHGADAGDRHRAPDVAGGAQPRARHVPGGSGAGQFAPTGTSWKATSTRSRGCFWGCSS
jgi:hypothetical protein